MDIIYTLNACTVTLFGIYIAAVLRAHANQRKAELRNVYPVRPARLLVTMVSMDAIGVRPWWRVSREIWPMAQRVAEHYARLQ